MINRRSCLIVIFLLVTLTLQSTIANAENGWKPDSIIGNWTPIKTSTKMSFSISKDSNGEYTLKEMHPESITHEIGEVVAMVRYSRNNNMDYVGKHMWGGSKKGSQTWGVNGGIIIKVININQIKVVFTDSKYTGGWTMNRKP